MSWISQPWFDNMAIDYYNSSTGVTSRIATGALRVFWQSASHQTQIATDLNGSGNLSTQYSSYAYDSSPQYNEWPYVTAETLECSDLVKGSYICQHYFELGQSGDIIWWYNKDNPNFKIGLQYRGKGTSQYGTYYKGRAVARVGGNTIYGNDNQAIWGIDAGNSKREWILSVMIDGVNKWAYPLYMESTHRNSDDDSGARSYPFGWYASDRATFNNWKNYYYLVFKDMPPEPTGDPYPSNNYDTPIGGEGDHDETSDDIAIPSDPTLEVTTSDFVTLFTPDMNQMQTFAQKLTDPTLGQLLLNLVTPIDKIVLGLHIVPIVVPYGLSAHNIKINFLGFSWNVGMKLNIATQQFYTIDCGSIDVEEFWGNCLDYNPYTKITIFLPFIGYLDLDADDVMGKTVRVKYKVDIATGCCIAFIAVNDSVMYQYAGNCAVQIPVSSEDQNSTIGNLVSIAVAATTGGAGVAAAGAAVSSAEADLAGATNEKEMKEGISALDTAKAHYRAVSEKNTGKLLGITANAVTNSKGQYHHGGALGNSAGFMGVKTPYLIIRRPKQMIPDNYGEFNGYPTNTYAQLGTLSGFTRVSDIRLNIPEATVDEIIECERLLKEGVVFE